MPLGLSRAAISRVRPSSTPNSFSAARVAASTVFTSWALSHLAMRMPSAPPATQTRMSSCQWGVSRPLMRTMTSVSP